VESEATRARDAGAVLLGLDGFVLLAVDEHDGELELAIETVADLVGCPECAAVATAHGRREVRVRDLPNAGRPVTLVWIKRLWRCEQPLCPQRTWSETSIELPARASLSARAARMACRRVGELGEAVATVAVEFGVGWGTVMRAVREHGSPLVDDPVRLTGVSALGVDETAFLAANASHPTVFATGLVDLTRTARGTGQATGPARLLDVVPGRSGGVLASWLAERDLSWREQVTVAALDPFRGYATALRTGLPHAVRVLDAFHVIKLGFAVVDDVRRRVQQETLGHRGRAGDPLYGVRRVLRRGYDRHSQHSWDRLLAGLDAGDPNGEVAAAWIAAQDLRLLYRHRDPARAAAAFYRWLSFCADSEVPELHRLARTLDSWRDELLARFTASDVSNGPTEAINLLIKKVKRVGHGFRNFTNYRLRLLLHCGVDWQAPATTALRGRLHASW
jgi:transposase